MSLRNGDSVRLSEMPATDGRGFHDSIVAACRAGARLGALVALPGSQRVVAVLLDDGESTWQPVAMRSAPGASYPSLTPELPEAQAFERALFEDHGIRPDGHPWLKPLRRHAALEAGAPSPAHDFFRVAGAGIHEVAVGPVHAGIIEPGHFRFQCSGETVHTLEIHLGYQKRGAIPLLRDAPPARRLVVAESIAGDTAVGHALAHCQALETLAGIEPPLGAQGIRGIALELERIANHVGDLGALCNDVGYLPGASWLGRLRGDFLNLLVELAGNRFGRGLLIPGGVRLAPDEALRRELGERLARAEGDLRSITRLMFESTSVVSRFECAGTVSLDDARALGLVGPAARASGLARDVRHDHPSGIYRFSHIPVATAESGDVMARALERRLEAERSLTFVRECLAELGNGPIAVSCGPPAPGRLAVSIVEGWRGEIVHTLATDGTGRIAAVDVVDPSLHNWFGLALALRGNPISDFPLCNKSFNLSYAGHDL